MDVKTVPVKMTTKQASLLLEVVRTDTQEHSVDDWYVLQDIIKQIEMVPRRVTLYYEE